MGFTGAQYCCPKPCVSLAPGKPGWSKTTNDKPNSKGILIANRCYERVPLTSACTRSEQCPPNAVCAASSQRCTCRDGYMRHWTNDGLEVCAKRCAGTLWTSSLQSSYVSGNEVSIGGECLPTALPLANCTHNEQCVVGGTRCRRGKCACPCAQAMLSGRCVQGLLEKETHASLDSHFQCRIV
jgi:hypothetical protein